MPQFKTAEEYVAFRVTKQRLDISFESAAAAGVKPRTWWEVVDHFAEPPAPTIVGEFDSEDEANAVRDEIRARRLAQVSRGMTAAGDKRVEV